jgi:MOSC domain-containing protein YiiM
LKLLSVSVSAAKETSHRGKTVTTGIFKEPVDGRVSVRELGLAGDEQADLKVHGGPNRAVYVYSIENYAHWSRELGRDDFVHGQFGENFTVEGMPEDRIHVGDVFDVGSARLQVTQPRVPCFKLGIKMGDPGILKPFLRSGRVGFYLRVLRAGDVGAGDEIEAVEQGAERMTVSDICNLYYFDTANLDDCKRALRIDALSPGWREGFEERLRKAGIDPAS